MAKKTTSKAAGQGARSTKAGDEQGTGSVVQEMPESKRGAAAGRPGPTHDQIAQRAQEIWTRHGCPPGEDRENWFEAEAELRREMSLP